ncbi:MAG: hypothetical protein Q4G16_05045 [Cruoricaptor ignavus]|nr:hypothetical protein [Cruoricaptor ignavus]
MKTFLKPYSFFVIPIIACSILVACNRDDDKKTENNDPFIGTWKLRAVTANGSTADVTNVQCWKDTNINTTATTATLFLSLPSDNGCQTGTENYQWSNSNGTYYYTQNGQQYELPIRILDNNSTLQLNISDQNTSVILSFTK